MGVVSVIIPVYNAENSIEKTIDSIICQSFTDWELILVNDGSTDNSLEILRKFAESDSRIKVFNQENKGPSEARNFGIQQVNTPYLSFVDADDTIRKDYLEKLLKPVIENNSIELVCSGYYEINSKYPKGLPLHDFDYLKNTKKLISKDEFIENLFQGLTGVLWSKLFKTEIIFQHKIEMPSDLKFSEDLIFIAKYAQYISKVALVFDHMYFYNRLTEEGLTRKLNEDSIFQIKRFNEIISEKEIFKSPVLREKLDKRTSKLLLKLLKDQSFSATNLKYYYSLIAQNFDISIFKNSKAKKDQLFLLLLNQKLYGFASLQIKVLNYLRNLKNA